MMMHKGIPGVLIGVALSLPVAADTLDFNVSSDAAQLGYTRMLPPEGLEAGAALLHHDDDGDIAEANLHLVDQPEPGRDALLVGVGGKLAYARDDPRDATGAALAVGAKARWTLPMYNRAAVAGGVYFAPSATTVSDIDGYQEYSVRGEFKVLEDAAVYLGYRKIELSFDDGGSDRDFDDGVFAGFNLQF
ncbi:MULTISPECIES: YfaZ family outer membrane protein [Spiribacter]|uniref:YfaZ family outer membrane protein n=1 Tax=Spiribacter roseus TaxID=1855875 RepID=A0ABV3RUL6_9GAMM|nr:MULTISPECIES: YfaZ family outer membrane protein [Spiribacter]AUB79034.1 hypothetical protein BBH56_07960 [Spiribacter roseus]KAF0281760.1 hypothetical protein BA900_02640 [Spiribacter roseus]KAF0284565.1 hypothetical protein BA898_09670 [Spiribacter roseus]KAF0286596.1 hypothetical protein BA899_08265 [Spiribacter sp. SSL99]